MASSTSKPKRSERLVVLDNAKGALAFLVVIGHVLLPVHDASQLTSLVYDVIYLFHMPLFVFITGLFSKSVFREGHLRVDRLLTFLLLAFSFQILLMSAQPTFAKFAAKLFTFSAAPWYLLSCVFWYLLVPVLSELRPSVAIAGAVVVALGAGCLDQLGDFLSLGRTFSFLPFFVLGYYTDRKGFASLVERKKGLVLPSVMALCAVALFALHQDFFKEHFYLVYGNSPYESGAVEGMIWRGGYWIIATLLSCLLLVLIPTKEGLLSALGSRSLQIYIVHRFLRKAVQGMGLYSHPLLSGATAESLAVLMALSAVFVAVSLLPPVSLLIDRANSLRWSAALKRDR